MANAGTPAGKSGQKEALKQVSNQISGAAADIAVVGKTIRSCPEATKTTRSAIQTVQSVSQQFFYTLAILLVLFIVHQVRTTQTEYTCAQTHKCHVLSCVVVVADFRVD